MLKLTKQTRILVCHSFPYKTNYIFVPVQWTIINYRKVKKITNFSFVNFLEE